MLASLYHNLHDFSYCDSRAIGARVTLLHIWAWGHIVVLRPRVSVVDIEPNDLAVQMYRGSLTFMHIG